MPESNPYDKAARYLAKLDPAGLILWLLGPTLRFVRWLDARTLTYPGQPDRTCDTVAQLDEDDTPPWAVPIEFMAEADGSMFGRLLVYLGNVWLEKRPDPEPGSRYQVGACVVNLTGQGHSSRTFRPRRRRRPFTGLLVEERNLETMKAVTLLNQVARQQASRCLLALIPLMQGGDDPGILRRWLSLASAEPDRQVRSDVAGLAIVFAELTGRAALWRENLKEWNMIESQIVKEWQAQGEARGEARGVKLGRLEASRETLRILLEERFGPLPAELAQRIQDTTDLAQLQAALRQVVHIGTLAELQL